jgi:hypothetical protein
MTTIVFDSDALTAFAKNQTLRATVALLVDRGWDVLVPAIILAEATSGKPQTDATTNRTLLRFGTVVTDAATARYAALLRSRAIRNRAARPPSGVDAIVAAHAALARRPTVVFTSDVDDLSRLLEGHAQVTVRRVP